VAWSYRAVSSEDFPSAGGFASAASNSLMRLPADSGFLPASANCDSKNATLSSNVSAFLFDSDSLLWSSWILDSAAALAAPSSILGTDPESLDSSSRIFAEGWESSSLSSSIVFLANSRSRFACESLVSSSLSFASDSALGTDSANRASSARRESLRLGGCPPSFRVPRSWLSGGGALGHRAQKVT
jgi:hypothetical protein